MAVAPNLLVNTGDLAGDQSQLQKELEAKKAGEAAMADQQATAQGLAGGQELGDAGATTPQVGGTGQPATGAPPGSTPTFAQLQAQGMARPPAPPAPPPVPTAPTMVPGVNGQGGTANELRDYILSVIQNPSTFNDADQEARVTRSAQGIDDEYAGKEQLLKEEMYRRGLADSTTYGGRTQDLNVAKRTAKTDSLAQLEADYAERKDASRMQGASLGTQVLGLDQSADLAKQQMAMQERIAAVQADLDRQRIALESEVAKGNLTIAEATLKYQQSRGLAEDEQNRIENDYNDRALNQQDEQFDINSFLEILRQIGIDPEGYSDEEIQNPSGGDQTPGSIGTFPGTPTATPPQRIGQWEIGPDGKPRRYTG